MTLTPQDCDAILARLPRPCKAAAPMVRRRRAGRLRQQELGPTADHRHHAGLPRVRDWPLDEGSCFTEQDVRNSSKVCLIGQTPVTRAVRRRIPSARRSALSNVSMHVVGVLVRKGANMFGQDQDDVVIAPWTTIKYRVSGKGDSSAPGARRRPPRGTAVNSLKQSLPEQRRCSSIPRSPTPGGRHAATGPVHATSTTSWPPPTARRTSPPRSSRSPSLLRERHHIRGDRADDFNVRDMTEINNTLASTTD